MIGRYLLIGFAVAGAVLSSPQSGPAIIEKYYSPIEVAVPARIISTPVVRLVKSNFAGNVQPTAIDAEEPQTPPLPILQAPGVTLPTIETPIVALPSPPIPSPRVLSERCICTKTVVKPQIIQRAITIPKIQRYLRRTYTPVIENIIYKAKPKNSPCNLCESSLCKKCTRASNGSGYSSKIC